MGVKGRKLLGELDLGSDVVGGVRERPLVRNGWSRSRR